MHCKRQLCHGHLCQGPSCPAIQSMAPENIIISSSWNYKRQTWQSKTCWLGNADLLERAQKAGEQTNTGGAKQSSHRDLSRAVCRLEPAAAPHHRRPLPRTTADRSDRPAEVTQQPANMHGILGKASSAEAKALASVATTGGRRSAMFLPC